MKKQIKKKKKYNKKYDINTGIKYLYIKDFIFHESYLKDLVKEFNLRHKKYVRISIRAFIHKIDIYIFFKIDVSYMDKIRYNKLIESMIDKIKIDVEIDNHSIVRQMIKYLKG